MYLGALSKALDDIDPQRDVEMDVESIDISLADVSMSEPEPESGSAGQPVRHPVRQPVRKSEPQESESPTRESEPASTPQTIPVVHQSALVSPEPTAPLWPSKLGAQTARQVLEVDMPITAPWHQNMAYTAATYIYLAFNAGIVAAVAWIVHLLIKDINYRVYQATAENLSVSNRCARDYIANQCGMPTLRPALDEQCRALELCMDRDPNAVFRMNALARALAEALNAFFDPLSIKSAVLLAGFTVSFIYFTNFAFGFIRARTYNPDRVKYRMTHEPS